MRLQRMLAAAIVCVSTARPQTPPPQPPSPSQPAADTFFAGVEKFEHNAIKVTRVEDDHNRQRDAGSPGRHLSTIYVFTYDAPGQYSPAQVDFYRRKLQTPEWNCKTCDHHLQPGESTSACSRPAGPDAIESVVIEMRLQKLTFVHTIGRAGHNQLACNES